MLVIFPGLVFIYSLLMMKTFLNLIETSLKLNSKQISSLTNLGEIYYILFAVKYMSDLIKNLHENLSIKKSLVYRDKFVFMDDKLRRKQHVCKKILK